MQVLLQVNKLEEGLVTLHVSDSNSRKKFEHCRATDGGEVVFKYFHLTNSNFCCLELRLRMGKNVLTASVGNYLLSNVAEHCSDKCSHLCRRSCLFAPRLWPQPEFYVALGQGHRLMNPSVKVGHLNIVCLPRLTVTVSQLPLVAFASNSKSAVQKRLIKETPGVELVLGICISHYIFPRNRNHKSVSTVHLACMETFFLCHCMQTKLS